MLGLMDPSSYTEARAAAVLRALHCVDMRIFRVTRHLNTATFMLVCAHLCVSGVFCPRLAAAGVFEPPNTHQQEAIGSKFSHDTAKRDSFLVDYPYRVMKTLLEEAHGPAWVLRVWDKAGLPIPFAERTRLDRLTVSYFKRRQKRRDKEAQKDRMARRIANRNMLSALASLDSVGGYAASQDLQRQILAGAGLRQEDFIQLPKALRNAITSAVVSKASLARLGGPPAREEPPMDEESDGEEE